MTEHSASASDERNMVQLFDDAKPQRFRVYMKARRISPTNFEETGEIRKGTPFKRLPRVAFGDISDPAEKKRLTEALLELTYKNICGNAKGTAPMSDNGRRGDKYVNKPTRRTFPVFPAHT